MTTQADTPLAYTTSQAARILGVSRGTIRRWTDHGNIKCFVTPGGHRRFSQADIDRFLEVAPECDELYEDTRRSIDGIKRSILSSRLS